MNRFFNLLSLAIAVTFFVTSCSSMEDIASKQPYLSQLSNTGCLKEREPDLVRSRAEDPSGSFEMSIDGTTAYCKFTSLDYPCGFEKVNVNVSYREGIMTIVEYPSYDEMDCRCTADASFTITDMPNEDFILKIYHGDTSGQYNEAYPRYSGKFSIQTGSLTTPY